MKHHAPYVKGFTLLELLVALTLCTFIGIGAHAMLQSVINAQNTGKQHSQSLTQLQKVMWMMTEDMQQMIVQSMSIPSGDYAISFVRKGWSNPLGLPRSTLLNVAYELNGKTLKRHYWSADGGDAQPQTQTLLEDVTHFNIRSLSPLAIEITFTTPLYGSLRRIIEIPEL